MDDELREIRAQLAEERRRREEEQRRREEEQRRREEEQRRREEEQRRREEEQRRREDADERAREEQLKREEEQRKREHAERAAASAVSQDLSTFLEGCHRLSKLIKPVTEASSATGGSTTSQTGRLFPQRIIPWDSFPAQQRQIWNRLGDCDSVWSSRVYPSATNLDYLERMMEPIGSEDELRFLERLVVENMVKNLFDEMEKDNQLHESLRVNGKISFENQARFREVDVRTVGSAMEGLNVSGMANPQPRNTRADQFCVLRNKDGMARPVVAVEYKPPHKLTIKEICTGLQAEICPERDVIDKNEDDFEFLCKNLMAAVITQLFSYMIDKGVRYGYICTGEAYVFMRIPADPSSIYYSVNVPNRDYEDDQESRLERTAVSQVFAFIQQALEDEAPDQAWIASARTKLKRWKVEFIDVLKKIPETERKSRDASAYRPGRWAPSTRTSPIVLRKGCGGITTAPRAEESDSDDEERNEGAKSPGGYIQTRSRAAKRTQRGRGSGQRHAQGSVGRKTSLRLGPPIEHRPYCTHRCLRGMCDGLPLDPLCPNAATHGRKHISTPTLLRLLRKQLAVDRGTDADCCPLFVHGSRGALLKVCLTSHGYTMVAKAVEASNLRYVQHEKQVYDRLQLLQGLYVPVCCGISCLDVPYYYDGAELTHLLLMSWGGKSLAAMTRQGSSPVQVSSESYLLLSREALTAIHNQGVLHHDAEPRNMLYNEDSRTLMMVDFERSELCDRQILGELSPNRKRKRADGQGSKGAVDCFKKEASVADYQLRKALRAVPQ